MRCRTSRGSSAAAHEGGRPAGEPERARRLYEYFVELARRDVERVATGRFGADMQVSLVNDGPFTILLDTDEFSR